MGAKSAKKVGFRESIRNTFLRYAVFPILALVVLWGIGVFLYSFFAVQRSNDQVNGRVTEALAVQYTAYADMLAVAGENPVLLESLVAGAGPEAVSRANEELYSFNNAQLIRSIFFLFNAEDGLVASNTWEDRAGYSLDHRFSSYIHQQVREKPAGEIYALTARRQTPGNRNTVYTMAAPVRNEGRLAGYLVFDLLESDFVQLTSSKDVNCIVVTDGFDNAVVSSDVSILGSLGKFTLQPPANGQVKVEDAWMYLTIGTMAGCPFKTYTMTSLVIQNQILLFGLIFIVASSLLIVILLVQLSHRVVEKNAAHLDELVQGVEAMRSGNYDYQLAVNEEQGDEFNYLSEQYQFLFQRIGRLLDINRELSDVQRLTEIKQLQAQFNPHFIFNVLETIKYEMYIDIGKAATIVNLLARLLRYSISNDGDKMTLGNDMKYINTYLALQKTRYDDRLSYSICMPPALEGYQLPKLIIQPLVENCIAHGYRNKEKLTITITGTQEAEDIHIRVTDNGDGISKERLEEIRGLLNSESRQTDNVGLFNSHRRLQLMYGKPYGLEIFSIHGVGTEVVLTLPAVANTTIAENGEVANA